MRSPFSWFGRQGTHHKRVPKAGSCTGAVRNVMLSVWNSLHKEPTGPAVRCEPYSDTANL